MTIDIGDALRYLAPQRRHRTARASISRDRERAITDDRRGATGARLCAPARSIGDSASPDSAGSMLTRWSARVRARVGATISNQRASREARQVVCDDVITAAVGRVRGAVARRLFRRRSRVIGAGGRSNKSIRVMRSRRASPRRPRRRTRHDDLGLCFERHARR